MITAHARTHTSVSLTAGHAITAPRFPIKQFADDYRHAPQKQREFQSEKHCCVFLFFFFVLELCPINTTISMKALIRLSAG